MLMKITIFFFFFVIPQFRKITCYSFLKCFTSKVFLLVLFYFLKGFSLFFVSGVYLYVKQCFFYFEFLALPPFPFCDEF